MVLQRIDNANEALIISPLLMWTVSPALWTDPTPVDDPDVWMD
ncbi:hypothetical protein [Erwinia sp. HR93]|nr:hypothetical protein [Erwinia sp. HR93]MEA1064259.1 hypothetical protein [Erwinia sp. HR93]